MDSWIEFIALEKKKAYFVALEQFLDNQRRLDKVIFPPSEDIYNAFDLTPLDKVKVVILGQDPYHGAGQAHGLCFSVQAGVKTPPSLVNIYKELKQDIAGFEIPKHGNLTHWAEQGVLLLNTVLTVEESKAHSHSKAGWETFTDNAMQCLNEREESIIFVLWGAHAIKKGKLINAPQHQVLTGPHPSPLSAYRGFFGCQHFSKVNQLLAQKGNMPIDWQV
ncbi:uracil-DNA glycosylase [Shewanella sp. 1_MG-2023]|uniref:uracil-DNA glycosylase n=1 Tax=unclassified Shewanella TaxID=196818 RepID=UPI000C8679F5|nr:MULTISPECIES: uracil-DNA glycosylase [unclassified Shewanella]MDO6609878.1 uracil-DNA glycosylase [Shewanella sp. 7_MG-2023]MDO6769980.1 uracil-DNA glycosylase [Shewanella sp. 2_MG-2023]MDO6793044.1 uracil-DNA glycosylase [Shewanella sp. 1_MG-2023]PMG70571.1 uracil-DNA glycosylase [Shewanella sp. 10N.286.51.B7]